MDKVPGSMDIKPLPLNRLENFPIMLFTVVMGLSGLAIAYQQAHHILGFPALIGTLLAYLSSAIFLGVTAVYLLKWRRYPAKVKGEFQHPIRLSFFASISISLLLLAVVLANLHSSIAPWLWYTGAAMHLYFTLYTVSFWINHNVEIQHSNPAWFIPIVGNVVVPIAGVDYAPLPVSVFFFAIGVFFWVILFTLVLNRIVFHHQLPAKFMPTLFIFIAPPAVAFIAYLKLTGQYDLSAQMLYGLALFFTLLIGFMYKNFIGLKFFISWWAFTFPLAAMSIATQLSYKLTGLALFQYGAYLLLAITTLVIALVAWRTIEHMLKGEVCVMDS